MCPPHFWSMLCSWNQLMYPNMENQAFMRDIKYHDSMGKYGVGLRYSLVHYEGLDLTKMCQYVMNNVFRIEYAPIQYKKSF